MMIPYSVLKFEDHPLKGVLTLALYGTYREFSEREFRGCNKAML